MKYHKKEGLVLLYVPKPLKIGMKVVIRPEERDNYSSNYNDLVGEVIHIDMGEVAITFEEYDHDFNDGEHYKWLDINSVMPYEG